MEDRLDRVNRAVAALEIQEQLLTQRQENILQELSALKAEVLLLEQVGELFKHVLEESLYQHGRTLETMVSEGLAAIFTDQDIQLRVDITERRGKVALDLKTLHHGLEGDVLNSFGGGLACVQSLLLRIFVLLRSEMAPYLFLDESLAALSSNYVPQAGMLLKQLCEQLGLNVLLVTHQPEFLKWADHAYQAYEKGPQTMGLRKLV